MLRALVPGHGVVPDARLFFLPVRTCRPGRAGRNARVAATVSRTGLLWTAPAWLTAAHAESMPLDHLLELSPEHLARLVITSASRRHEPARGVAARLNLEVTRADVNRYAISARGFNSVPANKLFVMIDGRTLYSLRSAACGVGDARGARRVRAHGVPHLAWRP